MTIKVQKFYDAAPENVGGAEVIEKVDSTTGGTAGVVEPPKENVEIPKQIISDEELKSYGFDSAESLRIFLAKQKEANISDEEKKEKESLEKADFLKFATENKLLNFDELNNYESLKAQADKDIVFEKTFLADYKLEHPEITNEDDLREAAQEEFNYEYKLNEGVSEAARKKGEQRLAKEAKELRSPYESKVTDAQTQYKENQNIKITYPKFEKFIQESIKRNTPDKMVVYKAKVGDSEIDIDIELTAADREAMAKTFSTPKTYQKFTKEKPEDIQKYIDAKMNGWVKLNKFNEITDKISTEVSKISKGVALKDSSTVGSTNPYPLVGTSSAAAAPQNETLEQSNIRIAELRRKQKLR